MKQIKHLLGMAAVLFFAACSTDEPVDPVNPVVDKDQTRYLSVAISSPAGTRADYNDGLPEESQINEIVFCFYDIDGNNIYTTVPVTDGNQADNPPVNDNVTKIWSKVVAIDLVQGQNMPAYVMAFVNPIYKEGIERLSLKDLEDVTRTKVKSDLGFAMSNSVYYGKNPFTGKDEKMMATPINQTQMFESEKAAEEAIAATDGKGVITIHVERYAAKIGLSITGNIQEYPVTDKEGNELKLKFVPEFWRPNAISKETYITKKFKLQGETDVPSFDKMKERFEGTGMENNWNNMDHFRSFWACSPSYYANKFPMVSDNVDDLDGNTEDYEVKYFTYNEIKNGVTAGDFDKGSDDFGANAYFYSRETTTSIDAIRNIETGNPVASVASVVIVGHYTVDGAEVDGAFYLDHGKYYANVDDAKEALIARQSVLFVMGENNQYQKAVDPALFEVAHPKKAVRGETNVAGRFVTLQLKEVPTGIFFYGEKEDGTRDYIAVNADNIDYANRLLWQGVHTFEIFNQGRAFFNIPIKHLGFDVSTNPNEPLVDEEGNYNWNYMRRGDFGVVRNHVYSINVTGIKGLASGLRSDDQPIVPPKDAVNYYVAAKLNVLAWNVVLPQNVEL